MASQDDEIERLLREVEGLDNPPKSLPPATRPPAEVAKQEGGETSPRTAWAMKMALLGAIVGFLVGLLPFIGWLPAAVGGAAGGAVAGYLSGPRKPSGGG